ncbi:hypothetical protein [Neolewinella antarctica]|uniref:Outer membrane protein beta-barrel domain-containing protein n=1 Tax=Neolewinella antarctica TaxID=442734 RepID=A0ABX0XEW4_9BACT|nr:hypothetical protein [Neolewinella antarctica]NJC27866.1 hypothetical protein [Neolewinella antarctica]
MNRLYILLSLLLLGVGICAQPDRNQKFVAAGYVGANFTQVHGDSYFGYNKPGLRFGIETQYLWRPKYFVSLGVGFSQEGARPSNGEVDQRGGNATVLKLSMVEIPLLFNYRLGSKEASRKANNYALYRSTTLQLGVKLTRLTGFQTANRGFFDQLLPDPVYTEADIEFQDFDFAVVGGVTFQLGLRYGVFLQHSLSVRGLYRPDDVKLAQEGPYDVTQLRPYSITVGGKLVLY